MVRDCEPQRDIIIQSQHLPYLRLTCEHMTKFCEHHAGKAAHRESLGNSDITQSKLC